MRESANFSFLSWSWWGRKEGEKEAREGREKVEEIAAMKLD